MSDSEKKVQVFYNANHTPPVWYDPEDGSVEMEKNKSGTIVFEKGSDNNDFSFSEITITPTSNDFAVESMNKNKLTVSDANTVAGTYEYTLSLDTTNGSARSDPQIINKGQ